MQNSSKNVLCVEWVRRLKLAPPRFSCPKLSGFLKLLRPHILLSHLRSVSCDSHRNKGLLNVSSEKGFRLRFPRPRMGSTSQSPGHISLTALRASTKARGGSLQSGKKISDKGRRSLPLGSTKSSAILAQSRRRHRDRLTIFVVQASPFPRTLKQLCYNFVGLSSARLSAQGCRLRSQCW